jgi:hypothetical protein
MTELSLHAQLAVAASSQPSPIVPPRTFGLQRLQLDDAASKTFPPCPVAPPVPQTQIPPPVVEATGDGI